MEFTALEERCAVYARGAPPLFAAAYTAAHKALHVALVIHQFAQVPGLAWSVPTIVGVKDRLVGEYLPAAERALAAARAPLAAAHRQLEGSDHCVEAGVAGTSAHEVAVAHAARLRATWAEPVVGFDAAAAGERPGDEWRRVRSRIMLLPFVNDWYLDRLMVREMRLAPHLADLLESGPAGDVRSGRPIAGPPPRPAAITGPTPDRLSKQARALAALVDHPEWTFDQIAAEAGCARQSLYRMTKFMAAVQQLRSARDDFPRGTRRRDGDVDAWDEDAA